ncbi:UvrD-helicase domain-containing protein [Virgibacillus sp. MG-45]|uniref:UvrD-helicase domain-containing protein n=1 Tax=Virgibacillus sp. MG-45 TaxID=3102791 RepID=UPI002ED7DAF0
MTITSEQVLNILQSTQTIESRIKETYKKNHDEVRRHPNVRQEQMPVFVSFLYEKIIEDKQLPSVQSFTDSYMETYYKNINKNHLIYSAYKQRCWMAYESLVRDLHFYFRLSESCMFENVALSYAYDVEAKQDVVVTLGNLKAGLQLFYGTDKDIAYKKRNALRRRAVMGYPDLFLPLNGSETVPENIGTDKEVFLAYSDHDVKTIYRKLRTVEAADRYPQEDYFVKPLKPVAVKSNTENKAKSSMKHSLLYIGPENIKEYSQTIKALTKKGNRVEWLSPFDDFPVEFDEKVAKYIRIHKWESALQHNLKIYDGQIKDSYTMEILKEADSETTFNFGQYITEHAPEDKHIILEAGAGSGKTETMISRIIFLLHTKDALSLRDIVMITFTNEAADNMRNKLSKRLFDMYKNTGNNTYIEWHEETASMRIMTIPSFAKSVLKDFSSALGISPSFKISPMTDRKREIVSAVLDEYMRKHRLSYNEIGKLREYELEKIIEKFWNKMEQKGITIKQQEQCMIDWGAPPENPVGRVLHSLFQATLIECRKRFEDVKTRYNTLTVQDLTSKIKEIRPILKVENLNTPFKYLFVDEFQDTDDIQIDLVSELTKLNNAHLFVVGDIKQSIYRFRGANYTAFDVLEDKLGKAHINRGFKLKKNYRTSKKILEELESLFDVWRTDQDEILPREIGAGRLRAEIDQHVYPDFIDFNIMGNYWEIDIAPVIKRLYDSMNTSEKREAPVVLAVLVRTNSQARKVRELLEKMRENNNKITFEVDIGGTLFSSKAAKDLLILVNALCYSNDPESLYALFQTPFSNLEFIPEHIYENIISPPEKGLSKAKESIKGLSKAEYGLRSLPAINIIYSFIQDNDYEDILTRKDYQEHEIKKYRLNIYKILSLASESNNIDLNNIIEIRNWLKTQIAVNRDEDEARVEIKDEEKIIQVLTVHKAKGLEFDTVLVPYTNNKFQSNQYDDLLITHKDKNISAGWKIAKGNTQSPIFAELSEREGIEVIREEARLLYVALTRTENRLQVLLNNEEQNHKASWSDLIWLWKG